MSRGTGSRGTGSSEPEPRPAGLQQLFLQEVRDRVLESSQPVTGAAVADAVRASGRMLGAGSTLAAVRRLQDELQGLGPLQQFAEQPDITDILVDGRGQVWVDGRTGLRRTGQRFGQEAEVRALAGRLVAAAGRRVDDAFPCADVRLGRFRIHVVLPPISTAGTLLSIRIKSPLHRSLDELLSEDPHGSVLAGLLRRIVAARLNYLVSGSTGSGKTTLLAALLGESGPEERIIVAEDSAELEPEHPHVVSLQCRNSNVEGTGSVDLTELVRQALRMRPDRLVVGECRGAELGVFLAAMNTGHDGAGGTIHANSAAAVPARLAAMGALGGMSREAVNLQAAGALDLIIQLERAGSGRLITEIALLAADSHGSLRVDSALRRTPGGFLHGPGGPELERLLRGKDTS